MSNYAIIPDRPTFDAWCPPGFNSAYWQEKSGYQVTRSHGAPSDFFTLTLAGCGFFRDLQEQVVQIQPGDLSYFESHTVQNYGAWPGQPWCMHWIHVNAPPHWGQWIQAMPATAIRGLRVLKLRDPGSLKTLSKLLFTLHPSTGKRLLTIRPLDEALAMNVVEKVLLLALRDAKPASRPQDPRIRDVLDAIQARPYRPLTPGKLAIVSGLSESRLGHLFKAQTGASLIAALQGRRLEEAKAVLTNPDFTLQSAAGHLGFSNAYSFSKWFLKASGQRPGAFRDKVIYYYAKRKPVIRRDQA